MQRRVFLRWCGLLPIGFQLTAPVSTARQPAEQSNPAGHAKTRVPKDLPGWYAKERVCAHTRLSLKWLDRDPELFFSASSHLKAIGFNVLVRHIKSAGEGAWWSSGVGVSAQTAGHENTAKRVIDEAHKAGQRLIVYHRHMEDEWVAREHPDWVARRRDGAVVEKRGPVMCLNSPYKGFLRQRLVELTEMGADGFYFDSFHMAKPICWCEHCRDQFETQTKRSYPKKGNFKDPAFVEALRFRSASLRRVFGELSGAIRTSNPEAVIILGSNQFPAMIDGQSEYDVYAAATSVKTEYGLAARKAANRVFDDNPAWPEPEKDVRMAMGWVLSRDVAGGRPPHVWIHGLRTDVEARHATAAVVSYGGIANLDVQEEQIRNAGEFRSAAQLGRRMADAFRFARPLRWVAILYDDESKYAFLDDQRRLWEAYLYPVYSVCERCVRRHIPYGFVTRSDVVDGDLDGIRVLYVVRTPADAVLKREIDAFAKRGGKVVYHDRVGTKIQANVSREQGDSVERVLVKAVGERAFELLDAPPGLHVNYFHVNNPTRAVLVLCNDFSSVRIGKDSENVRFHPPPPISGLKLRIRGLVDGAVVEEVLAKNRLQPSLDGDVRLIEIPTFDVVSVIAVSQ